MAPSDDREGFGAWYDQKQGDTGDLWHRTLIDPGLFGLLGELPAGTRVLDLACGNGYIARRLARAGACVTGVDASEALLAAARRYESSEPLGIVYHRADAADLTVLPSSSFDVALSNMGLIDIADARGAIREVGRILRPDGRFLFSISHPCFDVDRRSAWEVEGTGTSATVFRKVTGYQSPHSDQFAWPLPEGGEAWTVGYHRPLRWYAHALRAAGLVIVDLEEPTPRPGFTGRTLRAEWVEEIPLHLVVEARKEPPRPTAP